MIKVVIIDDEGNARRAIRSLLGYYCPNVHVVGEGEDVQSGILAISKFEPEIVFLDVEMPDGTGFDLLSKIPEIDFAVIFVTAHEHYAIKAIRYSALDYLLKPLQPSELITAVDKAIKLKSDNLDLKLRTYTENSVQKSRLSRKIVLNTTTNVHIINTDEIVRCESDENYTRIFFLDREKIMVAKTLKEFDELLQDCGFFRIHQSHLINMRFVDSYIKGAGGHALLRNKEKIPVSVRRKEMFLRLLAG